MTGFTRRLIRLFVGPRAQQRIDAALTDQWQPSLDIMRRADVGISTFYTKIWRMERQGIVESCWDETDDPVRLAAQGGRYRRLYRLARVRP